MKWSCALLAVLLLLAVMPVTALAEGEGTELRFSIDNENIYDGMDKAYKDGYTPAVANGAATIVLPLLAGGEVQGNEITVTPGLGDTSSSPFVYKNYQTTVSLQENAVGGGSGTVASYLVVFKLALSADRVNGVYPVSIDVQAQSTAGNSVSASFTCYVTITNGKDPNAGQPSQAAKSQPKVIVSGYSISAAPVEAGSEFTATVTLRNTSEKYSVRNMTVTVSCDSGNFVLLNDTNVIYIDKLAKGATTDIELRYQTDLETPQQRYTVSLAMEYDNSDAQTLSSSGTVLVEVAQPLRVELEPPKFAEQVNAGDTMPLSFQVMNLGRSAVYNVRIELSAPGLIPTNTAFIGTMEAGTSAMTDMNVFVGTKNMTEGYEGEDKYGYTSGVFTLIYEDGEGTEYTQEAAFYTTIDEPVIATVANDNAEQQETAGQWWISILAGGLVVAGLAAVLVIRARRRRKANEDI